MILKTKNIFIVGLKGVAMANLALILKKMDKNVSGSDADESFITDDLLAKNEIRYVSNFSPDHLPSDTDLVVYAGVHGGRENPQVKEAEKRGIAVVSQPELIRMIMDGFKNKIAVCGTHGKTTTSALLSYILINLGVAPSYLLGAPRFDEYWGGDYQPSDYFVAEADEYGVNPPADKTPKFHLLEPNRIIATTVDFDHPDTYENLHAVKDAFRQFLRDSHPASTIVCLDDQNLKEIVSQINQTGILTYGFSQGADFLITDDKVAVKKGRATQIFSASLWGKGLGEFQLSIFGRHNILNAAAVISFAAEHGFDLDQVKTIIQNFLGAQRRSELAAEINGISLFDDYAHHPTEIAATIAAFGARFPDKRLIVIFQPHTFSRTAALKSEFVKALSQADLAVVTDIFASARASADEFHITSADLEAEARQKNQNHLFYQPYNKIVDFLTGKIKSNDLICLMGAGDIYRLKNDIIKLIQQVRL